MADRSPARYVLAAIPIAMLTVGIPFANRVEPRVFGLPFLLAWIIGWIVLTPFFLATIARIDCATATATARGDDA